MKTGLMGGTFDPPHKAHIRMAKKAMSEFGLDKVIFMTGGNPPHKTTGTAASLRNHMIKLATYGTDNFSVCDYEVKKEGYSYTSDTLRYLKSEYPDDDIYFIIGGDSFEAFFTWHEPLEILKMCSILVYARDMHPTEKEIDGFNEKYGADIKLIHDETYDISSSEIRKNISEGKDMSKFLDKKVWEYIKRNSLYKIHPESMEEHLKAMLKPDRYKHSLGVASMAVTMAGIFGADQRKAYIAGLLHDCAKNLSTEENKIKCVDLDVELDDYEKTHPPLIHAKVGAELVKSEFGIIDEEICSAIRWHTLGRKNMTVLEKIIYVADMTEPSRDFPGVDEIRRKAVENLDDAVSACARKTIDFNKKKGIEPHPNVYLLLKQE